MARPPLPPADVDIDGDGDGGEAEERRRFEAELEFVQGLANPYYLHALALQHFHSPAFLGYLRYLRYWKQPEYAKYIR